jgi:hypothetical protein
MEPLWDEWTGKATSDRNPFDPDPWSAAA